MEGQIKYLRITDITLYHDFLNPHTTSGKLLDWGTDDGIATKVY